jgi:CHASE2 domain-containing sensor protein
MTEHVDTAEPGDAQTERRRIVRGFFVGVALTIGLVVGSSLAEATWFGGFLNRIGYAVLLWRLPPEVEPQVVLLDMSLLPLSAERVTQGSQTLPFTDRRQLESLLTALIDARPAGIGVDIDISAQDGGFLTPHDQAFFQRLKDRATAKHVDLAFGVARRQAIVERSAPRSEATGRIGWLGYGRFDDLAASTYLPTKATYLLFSRFTFGSSNLPTLSGKLAKAYLDANAREHAGDPPPWPVWFAKTTSLAESRGYGAVEWYLADYSALTAINAYRIISADPNVVRAESGRFQDRIVLVGDATPGRTTDYFPLPFPYDVGKPDVVYAGVLFHAVGTQTLIRPLFRLTTTSRVVIDVACAAILLGSISWIRLRFARAGSAQVASRRLQYIGFGIGIFVIIIGVFVVPYTRLVWEDWLLALLVLWIHPRVEPWLAAVGDLWRRLTPALRTIAVQAETEET